MPTYLVTRGTQVETSADGERYDVSASKTRTFIIALEILENLEQESLDVSIWGSADGQDFGAKPILKLPQRFYRGTTRLILDLTTRPEVKFIRPRWDLNRWGRVAPTPKFVIGVSLEEVPAMPHPSPKAPASASA